MKSGYGRSGGKCYGNGYITNVAVIEIDHPATQSFKRQRMSECGLTVPDNVHFVTADLAGKGLDEVLGRSTFKPAEPAFFARVCVSGASQT